MRSKYTNQTTGNQVQRAVPPRAAVRRTWDALSDRSRHHALTYYCNPQMQVHHHCEHGGTDFKYYEERKSKYTKR